MSHNKMSNLQYYQSMFNQQYYQSKKQALQLRNQKAIQKFLQDTMTYAQQVSEIEADFQEILKMEAEDKPEVKEEKIVPIPKGEKR